MNDQYGPPDVGGRMGADMLGPPSWMAAAPDDAQAQRRRALSRMLMGSAVPQEAYRTSAGAAMGGGAQALQGLAGAAMQDPQMMNWLRGNLGMG